MEAANPKEFEFMEGKIPSEWDGNRDYINEQILYFLLKYELIQPEFQSRLFLKLSKLKWTVCIFENWP